jgi:hypothetical protein
MTRTSDELLRDWAAKAAHDVTLPSGSRVLVRLPGADELLRNDAMPTELRAMVLKFYTVGLETRNLDEEALARVQTLQLYLAATSVRAIRDEDADAWVPVSLDPAGLKALGLPEEDLTALEQIALRRKSPQQVTTQGRIDVGLHQVQRQLAEEAGGTVNDWAPFRHGQRGNPDGADGAAVREVAGAGLPRDP